MICISCRTTPCRSAPAPRAGPCCGCPPPVLALGVLQVVAVDALVAAGRVAGEGDARARVGAEVAEDHRADVDGRAEVVRDALLAAVELGASVFQESKTALMARSICSRGSCGKSRPTSVLTIRLNW